MAWTIFHRPTRIGPRMRQAVEVVKGHPGCTKLFVAERISPHPEPWRNWALGYNPINRAIATGLIRAEPMGNRYALYAAAEP